MEAMGITEHYRASVLREGGRGKNNFPDAARLAPRRLRAVSAAKGSRIMVGERFDTGRDHPPARAESEEGAPRYLGIHFACCSVYARIYVNRTMSGYVGHCPRCGRRIEFRIGPGGTDDRFFTVY
jgi:hypothetical protein